MTDEPIDAEATEEPGTDLEPVQAAATLFRTDEPALIIARATGVADALKKVLVDRELISNISGKEYVRVEGWTLTGTMLGVFPVCVWTRKLEDGWEARVEARTLTGAVVGAAEAMCVRSEKLWANRDEYAIRSMAQTRATSKALRQPLDFVVRLAGFEATPAEEMPTGGSPEPVRSQTRREGPPSYPVPKSWPKVLEAFRACDNPDESQGLYEAFLRAATYHVYGKTSLKELASADERKVMLQKAGGAVCWLHDTDAGRDGPFSFFLEANHRAAWATVLDGTMLEIPDYEPPATESSAEAEAASYDEEAARIAAEVFAEDAS